MYCQGDCIKDAMPLTRDHFHCIRIHTYMNTENNTYLIFINENKSVRRMVKRQYGNTHISVCLQ